MDRIYAQNITMTQNSIKNKRDGVKHQARLTYLRKMVNLLQAHLVATPMDDRFISFSPNEDAQFAFYRMDSRHVDYAPIMKNGDPTGYVYKNDLAFAIGKTCRQLAKQITAKNRISPKSSLVNVLERLVDEPFLFMVEHKHLRGIITRADVNKRAFRTLFYIVLSELESLLVNLIRIRLPCEKHLHFLSEDRAKEVLYNYWKAKSRNIEIAAEQYLSFSDIINIISKSEDMPVWLLLGCTSKKQIKNLNPIVHLRNRVMHSTRSLLDQEDSILRIWQLYTQIWELIEILVDNEDLDESDILSVTFEKKYQDFRFILKSGAVVRTSLDDIDGKELETLGIEKVHKFLGSKNRMKKIDQTTMRRLKDTILFNELFKQRAYVLAL